MADIEDLGYTSILDMGNDEAIDLLRQIRLSRRIPEKKVTKTISTKPKAPVVDANLAAQLLEILGGK